MNSSKMSLKEGFDFLFEEDTQTKQDLKSSKKFGVNYNKDEVEIKSLEQKIAFILTVDVVSSVVSGLDEPLLAKIHDNPKDAGSRFEWVQGQTISFKKLNKRFTSVSNFSEDMGFNDDNVKNATSLAKALRFRYQICLADLIDAGASRMMLTEAKNNVLKISIKKYVLMNNNLKSNLINSTKTNLDFTQIFNAVLKAVNSGQLLKTAASDDKKFKDSESFVDLSENQKIAFAVKEFFKGLTASMRKSFGKKRVEKLINLLADISNNNIDPNKVVEDFLKSLPKSVSAKNKAALKALVEKLANSPGKNQDNIVKMATNTAQIANLNVDPKDDLPEKEIEQNALALANMIEKPDLTDQEIKTKIEDIKTGADASDASSDDEEPTSSDDSDDSAKNEGRRLIYNLENINISSDDDAVKNFAYSAALAISCIEIEEIATQNKIDLIITQSSNFKKLFKKLNAIAHPDVGGNIDITKILNTSNTVLTKNYKIDSEKSLFEALYSKDDQGNYKIDKAEFKSLLSNLRSNYDSYNSTQQIYAAIEKFAPASNKEESVDLPSVNYTGMLEDANFANLDLVNGVTLLALASSFGKAINLSNITSYKSFQNEVEGAIDSLYDDKHFFGENKNTVKINFKSMCMGKSYKSFRLNENKNNPEFVVEINKKYFNMSVKTFEAFRGKSPVNPYRLFAQFIATGITAGSYPTFKLLTEIEGENYNLSVTLNNIIQQYKKEGTLKIKQESSNLSDDKTSITATVKLENNESALIRATNAGDHVVLDTPAGGLPLEVPISDNMTSVSTGDEIITQLSDAGLDASVQDDDVLGKSREEVEQNRQTYEDSHTNVDSILSDALNSKELKRIQPLIRDKDFVKDLEENLTPQIISDIKAGKDAATIEIPLSMMLQNYQIDLGPIKRIMKNILTKDEEDLSAVMKLSMLGMSKKIYQDQFDIHLGSTVGAAFEQIVYGSTSFDVSEGLLREGFLTGIKNLSSDLGGMLKKLWQGKDTVQRVKMVTALAGLGSTIVGSAPVAAGLYAVSASAGLGRRFVKEIPEEKQARKDWFPEGQTILNAILEEKQSDEFITTIVKTNIINTVIKAINPDYKFRQKIVDPKKLQPVVEEFVSQKEMYRSLTNDQKELFKKYSKKVHEKINKLPWSDYGANSLYSEFAIVSDMHINRLLNKVFLAKGGIELLEAINSGNNDKQEELANRIKSALDELNIQKIYASRLRQVTKKRSSLVKGNLSNWFKDRVKPQWKTTVYAEFSSDIVKQVIGVEQSFMPKKSDVSFKDKAKEYVSSLGKERGVKEENYLGYSLGDLLFENVIFENTEMFLKEEEQVQQNASSASKRTRSDIDDQSVGDTESTIEDLLIGISPTKEFLTGSLERENLYQSIVSITNMPYKDTEIVSKMVKARDYVKTAAEAVKLQGVNPRMDLINSWYEVEPNEAGEGQQIISYWYSTKTYAGTADQLRLAIRNTATGDINFIGNQSTAIDLKWDGFLEENGLKLDGTNGLVELPGCTADLIDLNDPAETGALMSDLKTGLVGSITDQFLKTSESMTVEEFIQKTEDAFGSSEGGMHVIIPNENPAEMFERIAKTTAKYQSFLIMKLKAGMASGKITGAVPTDVFMNKGQAAFALSEKVMRKAGLDQETLNAFKALKKANEKLLQEYIDLKALKLKPMTGDIKSMLEKGYVENYREHIGSLTIDKQEKLVDVVVKVKGEAANAGLNLGSKIVTREELNEKIVTKYKAVRKEIKVPINNDSAIDKFLEKFYNFSSALRTANLITSIGTFLWKRGIDFALFQRHFMENIRLHDAINTDIMSIVMGGEPKFSNASNVSIPTSGEYENPAVDSVLNTAEDVVTSGVAEGYVYKNDLSKYLFENRLVTKRKKVSKIKSKKLTNEINEHRKLQDMFRNMF